MTPLAGTGRLVRLVLRRDRLRLSLWIGGLVTLMAVSAAQVGSLYRDPARLDSYVRTMRGNAALVVFAGPGYGFDHPNVGTILVNETSLWMMLGCALMSVFLVNRHTRAEEDSERADLVRSLVVGRHAPTTAVLVVAVLANGLVVLGGVAAGTASGYELSGTIALGASIGLVGVVFAAVTAVAVQVANGGRAALGLGAGAVALAFAVRGIGDVAAPALSWITPFGWGIGVRAFAGERWWTLPWLVGASVALTVASFALSSRRDLGSGLLPRRAGRASAAPWATHPLGLAFRLQRTSLSAWSVGLFAVGVVYGSVGDDVADMVADNPDLAAYLAQLGDASITDAYLATALRLLALLAAGFAVSSALRNRSDEAAGYAELVLGGAVSRWRWAGSHLAVTAAGTVAVTAAAGLGTGVGYGAASGDASQVVRLTVAALATLPAALVLVGVATALFGWVPRATGASWGALAVVAVIGVFATALRLPRWLVLLSPLEHVPQVPAAGWRATPLVVLLGIGATLAAGGLVGFRRRDLVAS